jgi:hypothetical protein
MRATRITALALCGVVLCSAADLTVRLLDGRTGAAMPDKPVVVWINLSPPRMFEGRTGPDGVALVHVPEDQPFRTVTVAESSYYGVIPCVHRSWRENEFQYEDVLGSGVIAVNACDPKGRLKPTLTTRPREVVIFARKPNWWEAFWMRGQF